MIEILNGTQETVSYDKNTGIRLYRNIESEDYPIHWHTAIEVIMPIKNIYTIAINDEKHTLNPRDIILVSSGELHELFSPEDGERIILQIDYYLLNQINGLDSTLYIFQPYVIITEKANKKDHDILETILLDITEEYFSDSPLKEAYIYSRIIHFMVILCRSCMKTRTTLPNTKINKQHEYIEKFLNICNYISEHCTEGITLDDAASIAGFSKFHFSRLFKQFTGMSFTNYLNKHRIMHAERLLIDPNLSITEAAMRSGFVSLATFNRLFKTYKKCTPTEFKNLHNVGMKTHIDQPEF
jgi:AraC-like DNA-binding protein